MTVVYRSTERGESLRKITRGHPGKDRLNIWLYFGRSTALKAKLLFLKTGLYIACPQPSLYVGFL